MYKIEYTLEDGKILLTVIYDLTKNQVPVIPRIGESARLDSGKKVVMDVEYNFTSGNREFCLIKVILSYATLN